MITELFLLTINFILSLSFLSYFFWKDRQTQNTDQEKLQFFLNLIQNQGIFFKEELSALTKLSDSKDNLAQKTLIEYLKHNERLEKLILPQSVTRKAVADILAQGPEIIPNILPNEIEKEDRELEEEKLNDLLSQIPITKDTKVSFEGEGDNLMTSLAEEIEGEDSIDGKLGIVPQAL